MRRCAAAHRSRSATHNVVPAVPPPGHTETRRIHSGRALRAVQNVGTPSSGISAMRCFYDDNDDPIAPLPMCLWGAHAPHGLYGNLAHRAPPTGRGNTASPLM